MSRRHAAEKREVTPDAKYGNVVVMKFINSLMHDGKKSVAESVVYGALSELESKLGKPALEIFNASLENVKPTLEVKSRRVGGATYQVPVDVRPDRQQALAIRWIIAAARKRSEKTMEQRLFAEMQEAFNNRGGAVRKREEVHKMAEANKAFAHFRW